MVLSAFFSRLIRGREVRPDPERSQQLIALRAEVRRACDACDREALRLLSRRPAELGLTPDEAELEIELIEGGLALVDLVIRCESSGELPVVPTQHKIVGSDICHFSCPVTHAGTGEPAKLLLTNRRLVLLGPATRTMAWGKVRLIRLEEREILVGRNDGHVVHRIRCNTWSDALCAHYLARRLCRR